MAPDPSGASTPVAPLSSRLQDKDNDGVDGKSSPSWAGTESTPAKSPEPHWDSVIGAATD